MAYLAGVEPTTLWSEVRCSIQLSYRYKYIFIIHKFKNFLNTIYIFIFQGKINRGDKMLNITVLDQLIPYYETLSDEQFEVILKSAYPFQRIMSEYECALLEVETKLKVLNLEFNIKKAKIQ